MLAAKSQNRRKKIHATDSAPVRHANHTRASNEQIDSILIRIVEPRKYESSLAPDNGNVHQVAGVIVASKHAPAAASRASHCYAAFFEAPN